LPAPVPRVGARAGGVQPDLLRLAQTPRGRNSEIGMTIFEVMSRLDQNDAEVRSA